MGIPEAMLTAIRRCTPVQARLWLRQRSTVRTLARWWWSGVRSRPFPGTPFTLYLDGYRNIGFLSHDLANLEPDARRFIWRLLTDGRPARCLWDVGANIGFWSLFLSNLPGPVQELRCFEPDASNLRYLRMNQERNGLANWVIRAVGLSDHVGEATFFADPETGATGSVETGHDFIGQHYHAARREGRIPLTTIDAEIAAGARPPDFLKIDVEAHEYAVLWGGRQTLAQHRPPLIVEVTHRAEECGRLLHDLGYDLYDECGRRIQQPVFATVALPRRG